MASTRERQGNATFNPMKRLSWRSILQRVEGRRIVGLWYGVEDGYLRLELDDGSVLLVAASWEGCHILPETESEGQFR